MIEWARLSSVRDGANDISKMRDKPDTPKTKYHHGELPATLMALALQHIEAGGTQKLSLRALAREAGVSATAPYRHFPNKQCLLAAIATQGFETLGATTREVTRGDQPVQQRMVAMAVAYIDFALQNPTVYHLMFGTVLGDFSEFDMLHVAANKAYEVVEEMLLEFAPLHGIELQSQDVQVELDRLGGVLWAFVHGMASLLISDIDVGGVDSSPMRTLTVLREDPEAGVRLMFGHLVSE